MATTVNERTPLKDYYAPALAARRTNPRRKTLEKILTITGVAITCIAALFYLVPKAIKDDYHPRMILKKPQSLTIMERNPAYLIEAQNGIVATESKRCSDLGVTQLRMGGSAVDAAITATLCIGVVNSFSSGIGGSGFMTVRVPQSRGGKSEVFTIDFRGTAPAGTTPTMFDNGKKNLSESGGLSVTIPGEIRGLQMAHDEWGALSWRDLVVPAAELAMGWTVDKELGKRLKWFPELFTENPDFKNIFAPNDILLKAGDPIERNNYAYTLLKIANEGADVFYNGSLITQALVEKINAAGGNTTVKDFQDYKPFMNSSLEGTYRGKKIYTSRAPSSGPVLLHMLNLIEGYDLTRRNGLDTHRMIEAMKFGNAGKSRISDPKFRFDTTLIDEIHTKEFAEEVRKRINDTRTKPIEYYRPLYTLKPDSGTSHISVIDKTGMMVSVTSTINGFWGSKILDPVTGVILNNQMNDFSTFNKTNIFGEFPARWNLPYPGKRPLSSMCPTIIENEDGSPYIAIGASGGPTIFPAVFQTLINIIDYEMDPSDAIEFGRLQNQLNPEDTFAEETYRADILDSLYSRGHRIQVLDLYSNGSSCVQAVMRDPESGVLLGASDSRKNGVAAGY